MGSVFHIQRFSLYDGPGVRTVVFLKGCPLRCLWCHNPEGLSPKQQILFEPTKCIGCSDCVDACGMGNHSIEMGVHLYDRAHCTHCGRCASLCYSGALTLCGEAMTPEAVIEQVLRDRSIYEVSNGGLTLSGGEPLFQPEFTLQLLQIAKGYDLHTAIETCGFADPSVISRAAQYTDLFLYDYKATGDVMHKKLCGVSNQTILSNLTLLDTLDAEVILRCPIVPGCNDTQTHIRGIGETATAHSCIREVHLEPYHRLGVKKAGQLGVNAADFVPPERIVMEQYRRSVQTLCGKPTWIST